MFDSCEPPWQNFSKQTLRLSALTLVLETYMAYLTFAKAGT